MELTENGIVPGTNWK